MIAFFKSPAHFNHTCQAKWSFKLDSLLSKLHVPLITALLLALLFSGCSIVPKEVYLVEPSSKLEYVPQVYIRSSGPVIKDIVAGLGDKELLRLSRQLEPARDSGGEAEDSAKVDISSFDAILNRSRTLGAGIRGIGTNSINMEAVLVGDFVPITLRMGLAFDGSWKRTQDGGYKSMKYPLFIRPPVPGIVQFSTDAKGPTSNSPSFSSYPHAFDEISRSDLFISANDPTALFSFPLPVESTGLPLKAIALAGNYTEAFLIGKDSPAQVASTYSMEVRILMKDEASARAYRPIIRFIWVAAVGRFFGEGSQAASLSPVLEKDSYIVRGIKMDSKELRRIVNAAILGQ